jgi:hypothetical protein
MKLQPFAAFISHSSAQREFADRLQRWLEFDFQIPQAIVEEVPDAASRIRPVFRDVTDLAAPANLSQALRDRLSRSQVLIVFALSRQPPRAT